MLWAVQGQGATFIEAERATLTPLPTLRSDDYEQHSVQVTSTGGFSLKKVFYSVPSQLVGHRLRVRLPAMTALWNEFAERSDTEGWPAARFLAAMAEHEIAERDRRRIERHLNDAHLLPGKTLENFEFASVPMISKAQVHALAQGGDWLEQGSNVLMFGPPGGGKSHLASALGLALVERGWRVLFSRTTDLAQRLQVARNELQLESAIRKLDKYHLLILDDLAYVAKDQSETSVLFELISARYEH